MTTTYDMTAQGLTDLLVGRRLQDARSYVDGSTRLVVDDARVFTTVPPIASSSVIFNGPGIVTDVVAGLDVVGDGSHDRRSADFTTIDSNGRRVKRHRPRRLWSLVDENGDELAVLSLRLPSRSLVESYPEPRTLAVLTREA